MFYCSTVCVCGGVCVQESELFSLLFSDDQPDPLSSAAEAIPCSSAEAMVAMQLHQERLVQIH